MVWGAVAALILAAATWLWFQDGDTAPPATPVPGAVTTVVLAPAARSEQAAAPAVAPAPATEVLPAAPVAVAPPPVVAARATSGPPPVAAPAPAPPAVAASPVPTATTAPTVATVATAPAQPAERTYTMAELPPDIQTALPKFSVSGGVYSDNVAQRMLVVNGQVFNEGSEIAPGVVLEQIRARTALLKFRGLRISQPY